MRGCLVQISPLDPHTGARLLIRAGASLNAVTLRADGLEWFSAVSKPPKISIDFFDINYTGAVQTAKAALELNTTRMHGLGRDYLNTLIWQGAPITIWSGDGNKTAAMRTEFVGLVTQGTIERGTGKLPLQCEVNKKLVDVPLLNAEFGGGTGYDGDPEIRGQLRPACFGSPVNVPVFFLDQVNWIGQVDGYGNVTAIDTLYENAASFGPKQADYASYALLLAATIPEGAWATCVAQGLVRLGANPQGVITADPVCGYGTPGAMMLRWLTAHAGVSAGYRNDASFAALDTALAALLGHTPAVSYYTQSQVQVSDRMQAMCAACNATWFIGPDGKIAVSRAISTAAPAFTLQRLGGRPLVTDWRSLDAPEPWWRLKAEAAKTWRVHALNEIDYEDDIKDMGNWDALASYRQGMIVFAPWDGTRYLYINPAPSHGHAPPNATFWDVYQDPVDATAVTYLDGTPLEDLKPAAPDADPTVSNQIIVAGAGDIQIDCDFEGNPKVDELPVTVVPTVLKGGVNVRTDNDTSYTVVGINCTVTINDTDGDPHKGYAEVTAVAGLVAYVDITITVNGYPQPAVRTRLLMIPDDVPAPAPSTTPNQVKITSYTSVPAETYDSTPEGGPATVKTGAGGTLTFNAPLIFQRGGTADGDSNAYGKWQYRLPGGTWADVDTEIASSTPASAVTS